MRPGALLLAAAIVLAAVSQAASQQPVTGTPAKGDRTEVAPLGLSWGLSRADVEKLGVVLSVQENGPRGLIVQARNLPRVLSDVEGVLLGFGFDDRLWKVIIASKTWNDDKYGVFATTRFDELSKLLSERYGAPKRYVREPSDRFYATADNFAYSISRNERDHAASWDTPTLSVLLKLGAQMYNTYYLLVYEYKPLAENAQKGQRSREKDAL